MDTSPRSGDEIRIRGQRINARREMRPYRRELQAAAAGRPCRLWRYLFDDAVGQQQQ
jgi:hypothetical protein